MPPAYQAPPVIAPAPAPAPRTTGLGAQHPKAFDATKALQKRKSAPTREGPAWKSVKIVKEHDKRVYSLLPLGAAPPGEVAIRGLQAGGRRLGYRRGPRRVRDRGRPDCVVCV